MAHLQAYKIRSVDGYGHGLLTAPERKSRMEIERRSLTMAARALSDWCHLYDRGLQIPSFDPIFETSPWVGAGNVPLCHSTGAMGYPTPKQSH